MNELLSYRFTSEIDFRDRSENSNIFNIFKLLETVEVSVALCYYYYKNEKSIDFFFLRFRSQLSKVNGITSSARHPIPGHSISYRFQLYTYSSARSGKSRQGAAHASLTFTRVKRRAGRVASLKWSRHNRCYRAFIFYLPLFSKRSLVSVYAANHRETSYRINQSRLGCSTATWPETSRVLHLAGRNSRNRVAHCSAKKAGEHK